MRRFASAAFLRARGHPTLAKVPWPCETPLKCRPRLIAASVPDSWQGTTVRTVLGDRAMCRSWPSSKPHVGFVGLERSDAMKPNPLGKAPEAGAVCLALVVTVLVSVLLASAQPPGKL